MFSYNIFIGIFFRVGGFLNNITAIFLEPLKYRGKFPRNNNGEGFLKKCQAIISRPTPIQETCNFYRNKGSFYDYCYICSTSSVLAIKSNLKHGKQLKLWWLIFGVFFGGFETSFKKMSHDEHLLHNLLRKRFMNEIVLMSSIF
jgi:hypothetical protein